MKLTGLDKVRAWTDGVEVDADAVRQIRNLASLPIVAAPLAIMPDVHVGKGAAVGAVIPTRAAIIPAAVGVDIGCGMCAVRTSLSARDLPDSLGRIRDAIEARIPVGFSAHRESIFERSDRVARASQSGAGAGLAARYEKLAIMRRIGRYDHARVWTQLGTLGGGNHFIELCLDEAAQVWAMLHSGSRHVGNTIGLTAIGLARERAAQLQRKLPDRDLAWLDEGSVEFEEYVQALQWAQDYAAHNRSLMLETVLDSLRVAFGRDIAPDEPAVNCHHNYSCLEDHGGERLWITRKGAVSARQGQLGIVPGSMGTASYIVRGRGNAASYQSCSHGAGRRLSRTAARHQFSLDDLHAQTGGVECRKDRGVLDEIPGAYKNIDAVMAAQADLVEAVHTLGQVVCIKG